MVFPRVGLRIKSSRSARVRGKKKPFNLKTDAFHSEQ